MVNVQVRYTDTTRQIIQQVVRERLSLRGIERTFGLSRRTVSRCLRYWIAQVPRLAEGLVEAQPNDVLELDELWSLVGPKAQVRWPWLTLRCRTGQVVAYWLGYTFPDDKLLVAFGVSFCPPVKPEGRISLETLLALDGDLLFQPF